MKIDTQVVGIHDAAQRTRQLFDLGLDGVFSFEGPHDVFTPLVLAAGAEVDIDLYTNVAIALPRNTLQVAHQAWDLHTLSGGRFALGIGSQIRPQIERRYGADFDPPLARMREFIEALHAIYSCWQDGTPLHYEGRYRRHTMMPPLFNPGPLEWGAPPVWLGALGPGMVTLAGSLADGLAVMPFCSESFIRTTTLPTYDAALQRSGRTRAEVTLIGEAIVATGRDERELADAIAGARGLVAFYGSTPAYRPVLEHHGLGDLQPQLRQLTREGRWDELSNLVDDDLLSTIAVVGEPAAAGRELARRYGDWADRLCVYAPYAMADDTLGQLVAATR